jgi:hypothetical protein
VIAENEEQINDLFVRLNRSKPLTGAEKRNAMSGPGPKVIREISKHEFFTSTIQFKVERAQDQNAAAKILMFEYFAEPRDTKKITLDDFVAEAKKTDGDKLELAGRRVIENLDEMCAVFLPHDSLLGSAGLIPVYYWFTRNLGEKELPKVREFLTRFEGDRARNRRLAATTADGKSLDKELFDYDTFNRSTNDEVSHNGRLSILRKRFKKFLSTSRASR